MQDIAIELLQAIENDKQEYKYTWMKDICRLAVEYLTLDGLEDAKRAADIPEEIIDIIETITTEKE